MDAGIISIGFFGGRGPKCGAAQGGYPGANGGEGRCRKRTGLGMNPGKRAKVMRFFRVSMWLAALAFLTPPLNAVSITWTGGAGTNSWHTPANWDLNRVPGAGDDVVIPDMTPNVNVTYSSGTATIHSLNSAEAVTLTNGAATILTIDADSTLIGPFFFNGGLAGAGNITVHGLMSWTGFGTMSGTGKTIISASGSLTISDSNAKTLSRILENHSANFSWVNGGLQMNNGVINNESDGTFTANLSTNFNFSGFGGTNAVNNAGTFNKAGPATLSTNAGVQFNNSGTVNLDGGGLFLNGGGSNNGTIDADVGTTLTFNTTHTHGAASSLTGPGTLTFGAGNHTIAGTLHTNRVININGGAIISFNSPYVFSGTVNLAGNLGGSADVTIASILNWTGFATMSGTGKTVVANTSTVNMAGGSLNLNRRLENHSPNFSWTTGSLQMNGGTLVNESDGVITGNFSVNVAMVPTGGVNSVSNAGVFRKTGASSLTTFNGIAFSNSGTLDIQTGLLQLAGGLTNGIGSTLTGGTYVVAGTLQFANANIVNNAANIILDGSASAIQNTSGANALANFAVNNANASFQIKNGRTFARSGSFNNAGLLTLGPGNTTFTIDTMANSGTLTKPGTGTGNMNASVSFNNAGTIDVPDGMLILSVLTNQSGTTLTGGTYQVGGTLRYGNASLGTNAATVILDGPASSIQDLAGINALGNFFSNAQTGTIQIRNGRNLALPGTFVNQGQVRIGPGASTLSDTGDYVQLSGATTLNGGTLDPTDVADIRGGELAGSGVISGTVRMGGTCRPADLSITGDYQQLIQGSLDVTLINTTPVSGFGRLSVGGTALLAGALKVTLSNYVPAVGDVFDLLTADQSEVKFLTIVTPVLVNLLGWRFADVPGVLRLSVVDCGPGDADGDGVGDACDTTPDLSWFRIAGGGGTSSGGQFKLSATIGQHDACMPDAPLTFGNFTLVGGFWAGVDSQVVPACTLLGDLNGDGLRNGRDIQRFSDCLIAGGPNCACADVNTSGTADAADITPFVQFLIN